MIQAIAYLALAMVASPVHAPAPVPAHHLVNVAQGSATTQPRIVLVKGQEHTRDADNYEAA